ncbi:MAG: serine/threonine protein kinase, partial [Deltaproteobacteria bacterium]|nr:serine/threonine protein kinase [Deltaproteobacteria bacterium]
MIDVGQVIGNYKITAKLGEGGMGVVFLGEHPVIGKKVAMKAIHPELARNPEVVSRFVMEAKAVNQIGHEHIVDIGDFGNTAAGDFYFIMEYLQGESLADRLKREVVLSQSRALSIAAQVADALGASHSHGIIHRDLKPENIFLITRRGDPDFVKVLDFGLAKLTQVEEKVTHKTRAGSVMGTPYYMSPEQGEGKVQIDHRADIYSLGIILFEMLTGKVPFGGEGYGEIIVKHITHLAPSARKINPRISAAIEMALFQALAKDREDRFQTMHEFREALLDPEGYLAGAPSVGMPAELTGVTRLAAPMARREMTFQSSVDYGAGSGNSGIINRSSPVPSTFRHGVGQVVPLDETPTLAPKSGNKVVLAIMGSVALIGLIIVMVGRSKREPRRPPSANEAAAGTRASDVAKSPIAVRINFMSDPQGATVTRSDSGAELGKTPLSLEVPYSDSAVEFVLRKSGYEDKAMFIVPNLPAPMFATLRAVVKAPSPGAVPPAAT